MSGLISLTAVLGIIILEGIALWRGTDGTVFAATVAVLGTLGGWHFRKSVDEKQTRRRKS